MRRSIRRFPARFTMPLMETLESRELLSTTTLTTAPSAVSAVLHPPTTVANIVLSGTALHAQASQAFRAVIGTIRGLKALPTVYTLRGSINWGDGTVMSSATFVRQTDGSIAVIGAHTYQNIGTDKITVVVAAVPPAGTLLPVRLIGIIHSTAAVMAPNGGLTLSATAGIAFTANLGVFRSTLSSLTMTALITWGDGTQSDGKIIALPVANPLAGGTFAVYGTHTYATTGSYLAHITVYSSSPPPILIPTAALPPIILVTQFDSVIDVLPAMPTLLA